MVSVSVLSCLPALGFPMSLSLSRFHVSSSQSVFGSLSLSLTWIPCLCLSLEPCLWILVSFLSLGSCVFWILFVCTRSVCLCGSLSFRAHLSAVLNLRGAPLSLPFLASVPMGCPPPPLPISLCLISPVPSAGTPGPCLLPTGSAWPQPQRGRRKPSSNFP